MNKNHFCECIEAMRNYSAWERKLYDCGFDLAYTPVTDVLDALALCMCDFDPEWAYDTKEGLNWIVEWSFHEDGPNFRQTRHGRTWNLTYAEVLYDFLVFMNEHGWEDE
jgi:hypothetical protein